MVFPTFRMLCVALMLVSFGASAAEPLRLAVAANFRATLQELVKHWAGSAQYDVQFISGSSGQLYAQIRHGAPFDVYFSADHERPQQLVIDGVAQAASLKNYALGILVLVGPASGRPWPQALRQAEGRIALANPRTAPYGVAAEQVLKAEGLQEALQDRLIFPESVQQVLHYLLAGQAVFGFVSAAQLPQLKDEFELHQMPNQNYAQIRQSAVIPQAARQAQAAAELLAFVLSPAGQDVIEAAGYQRIDR